MSEQRLIVVAGVASFVTVLVRVLTALRELVLAHYFGTGDVMDAFLIASSVPNYLVMVATAPVLAVFVPRYLKELEGGGAETAGALLARTAGLLFVVLGAVAAVLALAGLPILQGLASSFTAGKHDLALGYYRVLLLQIPLAALGSVWAAALLARKAYLAPTLVPGVTSLLTLTALYAFGDTKGAWPVVLASCAGALLECGVLAACLAREGSFAGPRLGRWAHVKGLIGDYLSLMLAQVFSSAGALVSQGVAAGQAPGSLSVLAYGTRISGFIESTLFAGINAAVLPRFSEQAIQRRDEALKDSLGKASRLIVRVTVPLVAVLCWGAIPLVRLVFERGRFGTDDTLAVAAVHALHCLHLPFALVGLVMVRVHNARQDNLAVTRIAFANLVTHACLALVLSRFLGVPGIALSTTFMYIVSSTLLCLSLARKGPPRDPVAPGFSGP